MINKIEISDFDEFEFKLDNLGLKNSVLCIEEESIYIISDDKFFPLISIDQFVQKKDKFFIINENEEILELTNEQMKIIEQILPFKKTNNK